MLLANRKEQLKFRRKCFAQILKINRAGDPLNIADRDFTDLPSEIIYLDGMPQQLTQELQILINLYNSVSSVECVIAIKLNDVMNEALAGIDTLSIDNVRFSKRTKSFLKKYEIDRLSHKKYRSVSPYQYLFGSSKPKKLLDQTLAHRINLADIEAITRSNVHNSELENFSNHHFFIKERDLKKINLLTPIQNCIDAAMIPGAGIKSLKPVSDCQYVTWNEGDNDFIKVSMPGFEILGMDENNPDEKILGVMPGPVEVTYKKTIIDGQSGYVLVAIETDNKDIHNAFKNKQITPRTLTHYINKFKESKLSELQRNDGLVQALADLRWAVDRVDKSDDSNFVMLAGYARDVLVNVEKEEKSGVASTKALIAVLKETRKLIAPEHSDKPDFTYRAVDYHDFVRSTKRWAVGKAVFGSIGLLATAGLVVSCLAFLFVGLVVINLLSIFITAAKYKMFGMTVSLLSSLPSVLSTIFPVRAGVREYQIANSMGILREKANERAPHMSMWAQPPVQEPDQFRSAQLVAGVIH